MTQTFTAESWMRQLARARKWYIYAAIIEPTPGDFLVKFGVSTDPLRRVNEYRCGLPFRPTILWACAGSKSSAYKVERRIHKEFEGRRTFGEWFRFATDEKEIFKAVPQVEYLAATGKRLEWSVTTGEQWLEYLRETGKMATTKVIRDCA